MLNDYKYFVISSYETYLEYKETLIEKKLDYESVGYKDVYDQNYFDDFGLVILNVEEISSDYIIKYKSYKVVNNSFTVNPEAGLVKLKITTNKDWKASLNQSWCTLSATKGKGGAADLIITYEANPFSSERTATLTIKVGTATSSVILKQIKNENGKNGIESGGIQGLPNHKW
jgi:hypothetical protein